MSIRVDRLRYSFRLAVPSRLSPIDQRYAMSELMYRREAAHLLASLDRVELALVLAGRYSPRPYAFEEAMYAEVHPELRREAMRVLGSPARPGRAHDPYTEWRSTQLELFAELLGRIAPRPGYARRTIDRLHRRIELELVAGRTGRLQPALDFNKDLLEPMSTCVRVHWDIGADLRQRMVAFDAC